MKRFILMIETKVCTQDVQCRWYFKCKHPKKLTWIAHDRLFIRLGAAKGIVTRNQKLGNWHDHTGNAYVAEIETDDLAPLTEDAQQRYEQLERLISTVAERADEARKIAESPLPVITKKSTKTVK